jgi:rare lipoprotein A
MILLACVGLLCAPPLTGVASWYDLRGVQANGRPYQAGALTAASRCLPLGMRVRVTDLANGRSVVVRIEDRGPYVRGRILDLSRAAAVRLRMLHGGLTRVRIDPLPRPA